MSRHWFVQDDFFKGARRLRDHFDQQFEKPLSNSRFVWDYWHVPDQYSLLRTPAFHYFPERIYQEWHRQLVEWGREFLGCHDISPPWLSCYIDGCEQELHADHPHGPWAFVFSLTPNARKFSGGETCLLKPQILRDWAWQQGTGLHESEQMMSRIQPRFNRLVVFDPRLPHGVRRVAGPRDPRLGRLVMHGWFVQPRPFFKGPLKENQVAEILGKGLNAFGQDVAHLPLAGYISVRLNISAAGEVRGLRTLTDTLVGAELDVKSARRLLSRHLRTWRFPRSRRGATQLTLPLRLDGHEL